MNIAEIEINGKILKLESSVLTLEKYNILTGRDLIEDYSDNCETKSLYLKIFQKYSLTDEKDFVKLTEQQQAECNKEMGEIRKKANINFFRDVIIAMIMAGEYPRERARESIMRDIPPFLHNNKKLMEITEKFLNQIIDPDTKKKIEETAIKTE